MIPYYRARYYEFQNGRFTSEDPTWFSDGTDFYRYAIDNPIRWTDPSGEKVLECHRPIAVHIPFMDQQPEHTFLYSTEAKQGYGLTTKNGWGTWSTIITYDSACVPGAIEADTPFNDDGKLKAGYSCSTVSEDKCYESCVNKRATSDKKKPPCYMLGEHQCDTWVHEVEQECQVACWNTTIHPLKDKLSK